MDLFQFKGDQAILNTLSWHLRIISRPYPQTSQKLSKLMTSNEHLKDRGIKTI